MDEVGSVTISESAANLNSQPGRRFNQNSMIPSIMNCNWGQIKGQLVTMYPMDDWWLLSMIQSVHTVKCMCTKLQSVHNLYSVRVPLLSSKLIKVWVSNWNWIEHSQDSTLMYKLYNMANVSSQQNLLYNACYNAALINTMYSVYCKTLSNTKNLSCTAQLSRIWWDSQRYTLHQFGLCWSITMYNLKVQNF